MSMDINIVLLPETESVYLISGRFFEGDSFVCSSNDVIYLTVLPLDARFLPYTVKIIGNAVSSNEGIAFMCKIGEDRYALKLGLRYSFIYSAGHRNLSDDICSRFFYFVKGKHFGSASELLGSGLTGVGEDDLAAFFKDYSEILKVKDRYFLMDGHGVGHECVFAFKGGKIDNISIDG